MNLRAYPGTRLEVASGQGNQHWQTILGCVVNQLAKTAVEKQRLVVLAVAVFVALSLSGCDQSAPQEMDLIVTKNPTRTWKVSLPVPSDSAPRQLPKLELNDTAIDFGLVEPKTSNRQVLDIRNQGEAPLIIKFLGEQSDFSMECAPIPPGARGKLTLSWTPLSFFENYHGTVRLRTNDPTQPTPTLAVTGKALYAVAVDPPALLTGRMRPNQSHKTEIVISSQRWDTFSVAGITASMSGIDFELTPASEDVLSPLHAKSGWLLKAVLPRGLAPGVIDQSINLQVNPGAAEAQPRPLEIPIQGQVLRRIAVYGEGIDSSGTISFGTVPVGHKYVRRFVVKVHDDDPRLHVSDLQTTPSFVTVRLIPYGRESGIDNLYQLEVSLPATAPETICWGEQLGTVHFEFDHPRIKELTLGLDFILHKSTRRHLVSSNGVQ